VVEGDALWFVQGNEGPDQKLEVLLLERNGKSVDDATENLEEFSDTVVAFRFVYELVKEVRNGSADKGSVGHGFSANAVEDCLEVVSLAWIFRIEEFHQL